MQNLAFVIVTLLAALAISRCNAAATVRMQLTHADAGRGLSVRELMQRMALRSKARAARRLSSPASAPVSPGGFADGLPTFSEYLVHLAIGTPPQPVQLTLDTGSDLVWTQCQPCAVCFNQSLPYFDTSRSSTHAFLPCDSTQCKLDPSVTGCVVNLNQTVQTCAYSCTYGDNSVTIGLLEADTFTFVAGTSLPGVTFGCGLNNTALKNGTGGTIIDSGTAITSLPTRVYRLVRDAFAAQVKLPVVSGNTTDPYTCFSAPSQAKPYVPKLVLHFEGATMDLPRENYVFEVPDDAGNSILCLAIIERGEVTTIGNFQ
uniref:Peptidase A1 domain-containing protein n=1 Tax=Oryza barthii TaxID=65489 RepID=A0A0D3FHT5_9ORYZ